jgi:hypothetical protein
VKRKGRQRRRKEGRSERAKHEREKGKGGVKVGEGEE